MISYTSPPPDIAISHTTAHSKINGFHRSASWPMARPARAAIIRAITVAFDLSEEDLMSKRRTRFLAYTRFAAYYCFQKLTPCSLMEIGRIFDRDHTTIMYGISRVEQIRMENPEYDKRISSVLTGLATET